MKALPPVIALLALFPIPLAAEEVMVPGTAYRLDAGLTAAARVIFHPDGRVLVWEGKATAPEHEGNWFRRDGQFCMSEGSEFSPLCVKEIARGDGGFDLMMDGRSMEFMPLPE